MLTVRSGAGGGADYNAHEQSVGHDDAGKNADSAGSTEQGAGGHEEHSGGQRPGTGTIMVVTLITFAFLVAGLWLAGGFFSSLLG